MNGVRYAGWIDRILFLCGRRTGYLIEGSSMAPALVDGDAVLVAPRSRIRAGDIVLADHPFKKNVRIVKRVASISDDGRYELIGDDPGASTDSRSFGNIGRDSIIGRVVCRLPEIRDGIASRRQGSQPSGDSPEAEAGTSQTP